MDEDEYELDDDDECTCDFTDEDMCPIHYRIDDGTDEDEMGEEILEPTVECDCKEDAAKPFGGHKKDCSNAIPF